MRVDSGELMAVTTISILLFSPAASLSNALLSLFYCVYSTCNRRSLTYAYTHIKKYNHTHAHTCAQIVLKHHKPTDIKSTCQWEPQVCDPVRIFFFIHHYCWIQSTGRPQYSPSNLSCIIHVLCECPCVPVHPLPS